MSLQSILARGTAVSNSKFPSTWSVWQRRRGAPESIAASIAWPKRRPSQAFLRCLADRGQNLGSNTSRLLQLLDAEGADALEDSLVEVLERDTIHIGDVRQVLDRRRSERGLPPPVSISLPPGEHRDLVITPHSLSTYDSLKKETTP